MDPIARARINAAIRDVLAEMLQTRLQDPRLQGVTITAVEVVPDLAVATVYYSVLGDAERRRVAELGLQRVAGILRREIGRRQRLRNAPELRFAFDDSLERGQRIETLLRQWHAGDDAGGRGDDEERRDA
jgi:ribosome-binding factor A